MLITKRRLPNIITTFRFLLVLFLPYAYFRINTSVAVGVFLFAAALDMLDGYIARKFDAVSRMGIFLDPLADKSMVVVTIICLLIDGKISFLVGAIVIGREIVMITGGLIGFYFTSVTLPSDHFGKVTTVLISLLLVISILNFSYPLQKRLAIVVVLSLIVTSIHYISLFLSIYRHRHTHD